VGGSGWGLVELARVWGVYWAVMLLGCWYYWVQCIYGLSHCLFC
jgi:hypothetical protein